MTTLARLPDRISPRRTADNRSPQIGARMGRLVHIDDDGRPFVDFDGNPSGPVVARVAVSDTEIGNLRLLGDAGILLVFENNDLALPIIVGRVRDSLPHFGIDISVRGRRVTLEADDEVELRCGEARLRLTRDGKVVVLGDEVVSRARRRNRIKGGTVNIN